jgi:lysophospholipase L1-like esterase
MKEPNPYLSFIILLLTALALITGYSFMEKPFNIELRKSAAAEFFVSDTIQSSPVVDSLKVAEKSPVLDSTAKSIMLIGDSMLEGLSPRMLEYALQNGHTLNSVVWYSSTTKYFGQSDTLRHFIRKYNPDYIFLSLGANELFVKNIKKDRAAYVRHILQSIGDIPYIWIGPPNWKEDTGINELIVQNVRSGCYYPSKRLEFKRSKDGAHPTKASAAQWVDSLARWVADSSSHRILMNRPAADIKRKGNGIRVTLQPLK